VTDCNFTTSSHCAFEKGLSRDVAAMRWFWDKYVPDAAMRSDPLASPLQTIEDEPQADAANFP